ncbi:hypothetical protein [Arthrobacter caoxuetaonis]|uniref:Uncharacterized protein n=1 Tax=Arthrobacter caoxuetaonis TaxID=2886935 RepID=A0A9X1MHM3_9MICC|nr:hypothetical protein [Arthrobacter caoxuetaonis]MCC3299385.1 hypothetical protein [Arthrobacter caoxuetaonis]USQ59122.1 hypothetical protein NF551_18625 [Arthrobacter caoxuetaonis]
MPEQPIEQFLERNLAVQKVRGKGDQLPELGPKMWAYIHRTAVHEVKTRRESHAWIEEQAATLGKSRNQLADILYITGETDTHPLLHGSTETITALDLSGHHRGMSARSITYRDSRSFTPADPEEEYTISSVQHMVNGMVHINWSFHLHADTPVTLVIPPAGREA